MEIRTFLQDHVLLFDGAMGTLFTQRSKLAAAGCELANLQHPDIIREIHRDYLNAGCRALKTNTFGANLPSFRDEDLLARVVAAGCKLANEAAASKDAFVFADIGPVPADERVDMAAEYIRLCRLFLDQGVTNFLFETQSSGEGLAEAIAFLRAECPDAFILTSFAVQPDGFTRAGLPGTALLEQFAPLADAVGCNCIAGAHHMRELLAPLTGKGYCLSAMPNAGYPTVEGNRTFYHGDMGYYAQQMQELAASGVKILGGCCGTTPEHLEQVARTLAQGTAGTAVSAKTDKPRRDAAPNRLWEKLERGERVIAVELDPPADDNISKFMAGAWELKAAGVDAITIADCPIARARMDSSLLACRLRRELHIDPLPHMTCRDRNLNATKALLLGLTMEDVHNVLVVTGDPVPTAERDEVKAVYNFNSRKLARFISGLNEQLDTPFTVYGALNLNANNFKVQLKLAQEKVAFGVKGFLTQPVLTAQALENLKLAHETLDAKILGGIIPVISYRNACFMNSEVAGIKVDPQIVAMYEGKDRAQGEDLAVRISAEVARQIAPYVDGFYIMTPFQRTGLVARIIAEIRKQEG
jgi:homocysteine S-methyltransferase